MRTTRYAAAGTLLLVGLALGGCSLDLTDPNFPPEEVVFADAEGLKALAVGLQAEYSDRVQNPRYAVGLVTDELGAGAATFANFQNAEAGLELDPATDLSVAPFTGHYRVVKLANDLLGAVPNANLLGGTRSGILALANLYKAMALGDLIQLYERIPLDVGLNNPAPAFEDRATVLAEILRLLNEARNLITTTPVTTEFTNEVLAAGFNLPNTIDAMLARYSLIAGDLNGAMTAAQRVNLTVRSELRFSATDRNPIFVTLYASGNAYQLRPMQSFRLEAEAGDQRAAYWVQADTIRGAHGRLDNLNQYRVADAPLPVYLPDEMRLIMAEVHARNGELAQARERINEVRTQCAPPGTTPLEPMACLPALDAEDLPDQAAVLAEILRQRRYELYLQGLRFEDLRRFGQPLKYQWIPYPTTECDRNPNAPRGAQPWQCS